MTPTPTEAVEALARALCRVRGVDPDNYNSTLFATRREWHHRIPEARAHLELQAAADIRARSEAE